MHEPSLLQELVILLAIAAAGAALFERLKLPSIAGFLVMGALLGPGGLALGSDPEDVQVIAEFGVVFLLFEIGLERIGANPGEVIYVGDSFEADVLGAQAAGIVPIHADYEGTSPAGDHLKIAALADLPTLLATDTTQQ